MTAFLDLDDDGRLDPEIEPSTPCLETRSGWQCQVEPRQVTVLRTTTASATSLFVIPRWDRDLGVRYCIGNDEGCDAPFEGMPTRSGDVHSTCGDARVVWLDTTPPHRVAIGDHEPIVAAATLRRTATGDLELRIDAPRPERVLAWVGQGATTTWDSENSPELWRATDGGVAITIPGASLQQCGACGVEVAIAHHVRWHDKDTSAMVLDVRERRFHLEVDSE
ncbi:MAG: hypothetical protein IPL61_29530 [Myxococcales bacterium]|nr:hypothetical protein [Myxococcales bacterium]